MLPIVLMVRPDTIDESGAIIEPVSQSLSSAGPKDDERDERGGDSWEEEYCWERELNESLYILDRCC